MKEIIGRYAKAIVYTDMIDDAATKQIRQLCDQPVAEGSCIRIMPDVHAGTDCVIGFTAKMGEIVVPSLIGADIGCGVLTVELGKEPIDFERLDRVIRWHVSRFGHDSVRGPDGEFLLPPELPELKDMRIYNKVKGNIWIEATKGKLRGGNHFIEVDVDDEGIQYLVIHGGSRTLGKLILDHYQNLAYDILYGRENKRIQKLKFV